MTESPIARTDLWNRFRRLLETPVSGASLAAFRICFGLVMFAHAVKYLRPVGGTSLKDFLYHETAFNFTYPGFGWVQPFPEPWWTMFFVLMGVAAIGVALGVFYRLSAATLFVTYTYIFLSELAKYNNHYYLMCLFALLLVAVPADRCYSLAAWYRRRGDDGEAAGSIPFLGVFLLRAQLFIVYFYGGIAKLDADWLTGVPMIGKGREILNYWTPMLGLPEISPLTVGTFICWVGLIYDLSIGLLLLFRRTRLLGFALTALFHLSNHFLFPIGLFPIMALTSTLIFFEPDWPERCWRWLWRPAFRRPDWTWASIGFFCLPPVGMLLGWKDRVSGNSAREPVHLSTWAIRLLLLYLFVQLTFPLRHHWIEGDAKWTEEGQEFSWRMMLRAKDASHVMFHVIDDGALKRDARGDVRFDWSRVSDTSPRTVYVPVESSLFNWNHHPGLTATYEPVVGLRAIYRLAAEESLEEKKRDLARHWKEVLGREVAVVETIDLNVLLDQLDDHFQSYADSSHYLSYVARVRALVGGLDPRSTLKREYDLVAVGRELEGLLQSSSDPEVHALVRRLHPFLIQSGVRSNHRFLFVDDPELTTSSRDGEKLTGGAEFLVWLDIGRLRPDDWRKLPRWFVTYENRDLHVLWNYTRELNDIQKRRFTTCPWMIHQFAGRIADLWQEQTGRRPSVQVSSNLMMNYRTPQPLIDPSIDLASTKYRLLSHNEWILPLRAEVGSATRYSRTSSSHSRTRR